MSRKEIRTFYYGGGYWIDIDDLFEFAKNEKNNRIVIKGREFIAPVRCKDCKYWKNEPNCFNETVCEKRTKYGNSTLLMTADDFCSRGERKGEKDEMDQC